MATGIVFPQKGRAHKHGTHAHRLPSPQNRCQSAVPLVNQKNSTLVRKVRKQGSAKVKGRACVHARRTKVKAMHRWEERKKRCRQVGKKMKFRIISLRYMRQLERISLPKQPHPTPKLKWASEVEVLPFDADESPSSIHPSSS
jgi:hypothetical protein